MKLKKTTKQFGIALMVILFLVILIPNVFAVGLGSITKNINVKLGTLRTIEFYVLNSDGQIGTVDLSIGGLLKDKITLKKEKIIITDTQEFYKTSIVLRMDSCIERKTDAKTYVSASLEQESGGTIGAVAQSTLILSFILNENIYCNETTQATQKNETEQYYDSNETTGETQTIAKNNKTSSLVQQPPKKLLDFNEKTTMIIIISISSVLIVLLVSSLFILDYLYVKKKKGVVKKSHQQEKKIIIENEKIEVEGGKPKEKTTVEEKKEIDVMDKYLNSLRAYIQKMKQNGYSKDEIKKNLLSVGWKEETINRELR